MQIDANYAATINANEQFVQQYVAQQALTKTPGTIYTIPVVVHVIHLGEPVGSGSNISHAQVESAIDNLNDAYTNNAPYTGVDTEIRFCLASRTPGGAATTGINRVDGSGTSGGGDVYGTVGITSNNEVNVKALSKWTNTDYYNIWVVSEIDDNNGGSGTQGYAYFPGAGSSVDGAVVRYNSFGYDPDGKYGYNLKSYTNRNVTTIHELGHGFNLYHTFEGDVNGTTCPGNTTCAAEGDLVCDTPPHIRSNNDCNTGGANACDGGSSNTLFVHNFMDYSSDDCQTEFTAGQKTRMRAIFGLGGSRESLTLSSGCNAVNSPTSGFVANAFEGCEGLTVSYVDTSEYGATSWSWSFEGGTPTSSTDDNPEVSYSTAGTYNVTLTATNGVGGGTTETRVDHITVHEAPNNSACTNGIQNVGFYGYSVSNVTFNEISNPTDETTNGYVNYSCSDMTSVDIGSDYALSIDVGALGGQDAFYAVYIDYNDNGTLDDVGETVMSGTLASGSGATTFTTTVTIPSGATQDKLLRMRVINDQFDLSGPCDNLFTGESEDYSILVNTLCTPPSLTLTPTSATCFGASTGAASVAATAGETPYTYSWSNAQTVTTITGLPASVYTVTVTENGGCDSIQSVTVGEPSAISISTVPTQPICSGASNGSALATPSGA